MDLFDIAVAKKLSGGGGGGGGSSDFSTAQVTVINETNQSVGMQIAYAMDVEGFASFSAGETSFEPSATTALEAILYKGKSYATVGIGTISATGNAETLAEREALITGDCTITIS